MNEPLFLLSASRAVLLSFLHHTPPTLGLVERIPVRPEFSLLLLQRFGLEEGSRFIAVERARGVALYSGVITRPPYHQDDGLFAERAPLRAWFRLIRHVNARWFDGEGWRDVLEPHAFRNTLFKLLPDFVCDPRVRMDVIRRALGTDQDELSPGQATLEGGGSGIESILPQRVVTRRRDRQRLLF